MTWAISYFTGDRCTLRYTKLYISFYASWSAVLDFTKKYKKIQKSHTANSLNKIGPITRNVFICNSIRKIGNEKILDTQTDELRD